MVIRVIHIGRWICKSRKFCFSSNNFFPLHPGSAQSWSRQHSTQSAYRQLTLAVPLLLVTSWVVPALMRLV